MAEIDTANRLNRVDDGSNARFDDGEDYVQASAASIKAIDKRSVHRICSGQVVLTLATAVKELVENSIDAGATTVEIRLKEYGSEMIEVTDNGSGVEEKNFEGLTLKHHTSKLQDFSDLINVDTFGFRGEALSSLCALSMLTVVTKHVDSSVGTKLEFDHNGRITCKTPQARQQGTSVTLQNLFSTLPVRHKEFQRNLKKEFAKMVQVLNSYCIISTGVRITCTNQVGKGSRSTVVSSSGNVTMKENISNVFGPKQVQNLLEFVKSHPSEDITNEYNVKVTDESFNLFNIQGFISKCEHGQGRSSTDRQFYFINQRPCDSTKLSKVVNEVYHLYNRHQYPFVALHITVAKDSVDVNVTPDKRQVFLQDEKVLLAVIKTSLIKMYEPTTSIVQLVSLGKSNMSSDENISNNRKIQVSLSKLKRSFSSAFSKAEEPSETFKIGKQNDQVPKQRRLDTFISSYSSPKTTKENEDCHSDADLCLSNTENVQKSSSLSSITDQESESGISSQSTVVCSSMSSQESVLCSSESDSVASQYIPTSYEESSFNTEEQSECSVEVTANNLKVTIYSTDKNISDSDNKATEELPSCNTEVSSPDIRHKDITSSPLSSTSTMRKSSQDKKISDAVDDSKCHIQKSDQLSVTVTVLDEEEKLNREERHVTFSLSAIKHNIKSKLKKPLEDKEFCRSFRATISPTDNDDAEEELKREIRKDMFKKMDILGQFNLGFIIAKLDQDLFIVDQHATDEKYNFEMLQQHTVIQNQKLIQPQTLELTASNETILMDNIDVFKKNGFDFIIEENGVPTQRVKLTSIPVSKNWTFGKDDIEELIFMLTESPGVMCRPSRVRQMFASRACRKSIMIGTALRKAEMKKLVCHMGEIDQPWNCPHGRPTLRHLINLDMVPK